MHYGSDKVSKCSNTNLLSPPKAPLPHIYFGEP